MRTALILGIKKDGSSVLLSGTEVPIEKQKQRFKEAKAKDQAPDLVEIQYWESGSGYKKQLKLWQKSKVAHTPPEGRKAPEVPALPQKPRSPQKPALKPDGNKPADTVPAIDEELAAMSDEQLKAFVADLKIEVPADATREQIIAAFKKAAETAPQ